MKTALRIAAAVVLATSVAACGGGPGDAPQGGLIERGMNGRGNLVRGGLDANAAYSQGVDLKAKGDCAQATLRLRPVAGLGPGYENAQTALGECLVQMAGTAELSAEYLEGLMWLHRAADAGWPEAQFDLAESHATGPAAIRNMREAAYWLALYDDNPEKARVGFVAPDAAALKALHAGLSPADLEAGRQRAAQWQRKMWLPPTPPAPGRGPGLTTQNMQLQPQPPF
jgi:TPR repeat protein